MTIPGRRSAYVDESVPNDGTYVLSCALIDPATADASRDALLAAKEPSERKLHWHDRLPADRLPLVELVAALPCSHLIVVRDDSHHERPERSRRKCLDHLLWLLQHDHAITDVYAEARQAKQNAADVKLLQVMRASQRIQPGLRLEHLPGPVEPLLWIPDIVAGAFNAGRAGHTELFVPLNAIVTVRTAPE